MGVLKAPASYLQWRFASSEVLVLVSWEVSILGSEELCVHGVNLALIDGDFGRLEDGSLNKGKVGVTI
jgi:hypothetical protein